MLLLAPYGHSAAIKLIEMFELQERMPGMRPAEYQATIPLKFLIIIHNYANV